MDPETLDTVVQGTAFTFYFMLHGVAQHDLYHGGQTLMLVRAAGGGAA